MLDLEKIFDEVSSELQKMLGFPKPTKEQLEENITKLESEIKAEKADLGELQSFCAKRSKPIPAEVQEIIKNRKLSRMLGAKRLKANVDEESRRIASAFGKIGAFKEEPKRWEPMKGEGFWVVDFSEREGIYHWAMRPSRFHRMLENGVVFKTKEEAQSAADKMLAALKDPEEVTVEELCEKLASAIADKSKMNRDNTVGALLVAVNEAVRAIERVE